MVVLQSLFLVAGLGLAAVAIGGRLALNVYKNAKASGKFSLPKGVIPKGPSRMKSYYTGGFEPEMTRAEAALILGVRQGASREKIKLAHRRIMLANHPDNGGSDFVASKVNEAKDLLLKDMGEE